MFNFKKKLSKQEKLDFLEYLAFQIKSDMSFEKALIRYNSNENRKEHVLETCSNTINDIKNGKTPADALFDNDLIEKLEYGIIKNGKSNLELYNSLISVININKNKIDNQNVLAKAIRSGVLMITFIFLSIPFFKDEIVTLYRTFEQMQKMTGKVNAIVEIPFLIKYWWASFIVVAFIGVIYMGIKYLFKLWSIYHTKSYYMIFRNKFYEDLISVLKTFYQLQGNMSVSNSYNMMIESTPNQYWQSVFLKISTNLKYGGKASEILLAEKEVVPEEITNCFIDAEDTNEFKIYVGKAIEYSEQTNIQINQSLKEWAPLIVNLLVFSVISFLVLMFIKDILQNGLMDVMSAI